MRRLVLILSISGLLVGVTAGPALATHCTVADKPTGAGEQGVFQFDTDFGRDTFRFDLPDQAHENGSPTHGVIDLL